VEPTPQPGTVLAERYRLVRPLGRGGMGSVWRAEHLTLSLAVAVKIIDPRVAGLQQGVPRFLREARALAALRSPHIVQVMDFGSQGELVYLVMELLEGRTLGQRLKSEGRLSPAETLRILRDVCKAMSHAHERGLIHRDLKPDNLFLRDQSREHATKVIDFGIAKPTQLGSAGNTDTGTGAFLGTPSYMSPEQCRGLKEIDQRSDLWALGAIAYECLRGQRLFAGELVGDLVVRICTGELPLAAGSGELPPGLEPWLRKAMARDPARRFQSAAALYSALSSVLAGAPEPALAMDAAETLTESPARGALGPTPSSFEPEPLAKSVPAARRRVRSLWWLAAASAALLSAALAVALSGSRGQVPRSESAAVLAVRPGDVPQAISGARAEPANEPGEPGLGTSPNGGGGAPADVAQPPAERGGAARRSPPRREAPSEPDLLRRQR
jgi:serine/threonine protein kinase